MGHFQSDDDAKIIKAMHKYGGGFVKYLAAAFDHADINNYQKLKNAFPEYWEEYRKMAEK